MFVPTKAEDLSKEQLARLTKIMLNMYTRMKASSVKIVPMTEDDCNSEQVQVWRENARIK